MLRRVPLSILFLFFFSVTFIVFIFRPQEEISGAPPYGSFKDEVPTKNPFGAYQDWKRPEGKAKVGIQVGHHKNKELPDELSKLVGNTGAKGGGFWEWEVNLKIAEEMKKQLEVYGINVEILPATVPPDYWADVFIAIHADGSTNKSKSGYKFAGPWRDFTGDSNMIVDLLEESYEKYTNLEKDQNITRNMRGYYAFAWWRYEHSIHPMTTAVIAETGFLTNKSDQRLLIDSPEIPAKAISEAILNYLQIKDLLK